jgi:hypothetical protein
MSACAGSSTDASRSIRLRCRPTSLALARVSSDRGIARNRKRRIFKHFAGMVPMDRARQDWVYEYAETGRPFAARTLQGARGQFGRQIPRFPGAELPCNCRWSNGPAGYFHFAGIGGHKLSAIGSPQTAARSARFLRRPHGFAALGESLHIEAQTRAPSWLSAHTFLCRPCAFLSDLAACTGSSELPDGKVRWQKKFAFPARRMRRGLRF